MTSGYTKLAAYILGGLILISAVFLVLVRPALKRVTVLTQEERTTRAEANRLEQQIHAYRTAQSDLAKATNKDLLYSVVVNDKNLHLAIEEMEAGAKATGSFYRLKIERDSLEPDPLSAPVKKVTKQTALEEVPYTLTIQNQSYENLLTFFQYLENIPHFTELGEVSISPQDSERGDFSELTATINGVFLAKKDEPQPKSQTK